MTRTLKIDCDWGGMPKSWIEDYVRLIPKIVGQSCRVKVRLSQHWRFHFIITLKHSVSDEDACRLQFLLGDDRIRCHFNYMRVKAGVVGWNKLFEHTRWTALKMSKGRKAPEQQ